MIIKSDENIKDITPQEIYIVTDFDGTLTNSKSDSSWASIFKNPNVSEEFKKECMRIFNKYHPIEIDENITYEEKFKIMNEWYKVNIETLINYSIGEKEITDVINNKQNMSFRDGAEKFLKLLNDNNVPVIIISAGIGNIIEQFLIKNKCNYPNIFICSNFLEYTNGKITGVRGNRLIHSLNKNEISLPDDIKGKIKNRIPVLLGDNIMDINMIDKEKDSIKIGFLDENIDERMNSFLSVFDIVCTENTSYDDLMNIRNNVYIGKSRK